MNGALERSGLRAMAIAPASVAIRTRIPASGRYSDRGVKQRTPGDLASGELYRHDSENTRGRQPSLQGTTFRTRSSGPG